MSDESKLSTAAESLQETIGRSVDADEVESMLSGEETARSVGRKLGQRVGREIGAILGRELGAVVAADVRDRKGLRTIVADVRQRFVELLGALVRNADLKPAVSWLVNRGSGLVSSAPVGDLIGSAVTGEEGDDEESEPAEESEADEDEAAEEEAAEEEAAEEEADEEEADEEEAAEEEAAEEEKDEEEAAEEQAVEDEGSTDEVAASEMAVDDLRELREDTYRELLEAMSYRNLQDVAKEVGVKANLSGDEMIDRIAETFSEETEE